MNHGTADTLKLTDPGTVANPVPVTPTPQDAPDTPLLPLLPDAPTNFASAWAILAKQPFEAGPAAHVQPSAPTSPLDIAFDEILATPSRLDQCLAPIMKNPPNPLLFARRAAEFRDFKSCVQSSGNSKVVPFSPQKLKRSEMDGLFNPFGCGGVKQQHRNPKL